MAVQEIVVVQQEALPQVEAAGLTVQGLGEAFKTQDGIGVEVGVGIAVGALVGVAVGTGAPPQPFGRQ
ncbi:hypothetical protein COT65_00255 [Candidatus Shapirobacteria bacterium CG09_land_8_20_14_0_10_47_13]|uniref:Uncharacterized protein n=1 Tax=Candidatus Shapirobacteria bacterium CG09_land_8_20_14_0_10_47_13 TaxID=1974481 RepID=A0A2H0WNL2_9BACT|nr:MAG: hypothetical protein COT65_00255 [Candidatus Shapirobacteria bacterium CG09_land_8_20_14_0_10_47_13]